MTPRVRLRPHHHADHLRGLEGVITARERTDTGELAAWVWWETRDGLPIGRAESMRLGAFFVVGELEEVG